jgi:hypothetical protein
LISIRKTIGTTKSIAQRLIRMEQCGLETKWIKDICKSMIFQGCSRNGLKVPEAVMDWI